MRIRIQHTLAYSYLTPPTSITQTLRLTPRNNSSQYVVSWRIEVSEDCPLHSFQDAFGNLAHSFTAVGPLKELRINVDGIVDTQDANGVVGDTLERFPESLFLRQTPLTEPNEKLMAFAEASRQSAEDESALAILHDLMARLHDEVTFDADPTHPAATAVEAFEKRQGIGQDITHIFVSAARHLQIPARYISGYYCRAEDNGTQHAGHSWAEAFLPDLGWVAFDPVNKLCATDAHVRVAAGLDYLGAAPVRGAHHGGADESLDVTIKVVQSQQQFQN